MSENGFMPASRKLYEYMVENDVEVYPGDDELADKLGYHKKSVGNAVRELKDSGYIVQSHIGKYGRHYYAVVDDAPDDLPYEHRWKREEWLREKYIDEAIPGAEIAEMVGVSQGTIFHHLHRYDIDTTRKITQSGAPSVVCCELGSGFRSRWEHQVAHRLEEADVDWKHEPYRIETSDRTYLPDFVCGDTIIEVKGRVYEENDQDLALKELMADGYQIVVVGGAEAESLPHDEFISYDGGTCEGLIAALDD